jgi:hypothetical protein
MWLKTKDKYSDQIGLHQDQSSDVCIRLLKKHHITLAGLPQDQSSELSKDLVKMSFHTQILLQLPTLVHTYQVPVFTVDRNKLPTLADRKPLLSAPCWSTLKFRDATNHYQIEEKVTSKD